MYFATSSIKGSPLIMEVKLLTIMAKRKAARAYLMMIVMIFMSVDVWAMMVVMIAFGFMICS